MRLAAAMLVLCPVFSGCGVGKDFRPIPMTQTERALTSRIQSVDDETASRARSEVMLGHPDWDVQTKAAIKNGEAVAGMTRLQILTSWGGDLYLRQMAGGAIIDRQRRERWLYDQAPLLVMAFFADDSFVTARAYDADGNSVPMEQGSFGLRLPARAATPTPYGDPKLLHLAQRVEPKY